MSRQPALFVGHGNPMHAITANPWAAAWRTLGASLPRPRAVLAVSAHWYGPDSAVTAMPAPRTLHDFHGFPPELHAVRYPAPGDPVLAREVADLLGADTVRLDEAWGLDHGSWAVLRHLLPAADVPVVQLAVDARLSGAAHLARGHRLGVLRDEGVLILGSGNVVHNLRRMVWTDGAAPAAWAERFEALVRDRIAAHDDASLLEPLALGADAALAVPTPEHYLPLLYVLGARQADESVSFPVTGIDAATISMLAVQVGA
jgi:4,5-DOPA dioxygenase extradiol